MINYRARLLRFEEKEKQWERDVGIWDEKQKNFETKQAELEKELEELKKNNKEQQVSVIPYYVQTGTYSLAQAMSRVNLKALEITGLKKRNVDLEDMD